MKIAAEDAARTARTGAMLATLTLILAYVAGAVRYPSDAFRWLVYAAVAALLLSGPLVRLFNGAAERRARGAFWCAMLSMLFACHGVVLVVTMATRSLGVVILAAGLVLFFASNVQLRLAGGRGG